MSNFILPITEIVVVQNLLQKGIDAGIYTQSDCAFNYTPITTHAAIEHEDGHRILNRLRHMQMVELPENLAKDLLFLGLLNQEVNSVEAAMWEGELEARMEMLYDSQNILVLRRFGGEIIVAERDRNAPAFLDEIEHIVGEVPEQGWSAMREAAATFMAHDKQSQSAA